MNKRFKNVEEKLDWGTIQYFTYNDEKITDDDIENLVNQLLEQNEQLKQEYQKLKHRHSLLHDECLDIECERNSLKKDVESLEKENEQLKNRLKQAIHEINNYTCRIKQLQDKIDVKEALLKQYEEEHDGLKRTINIQKECIQELENLFKKYGEDNVSFELLDDAMESYLND